MSGEPATAPAPAPEPASTSAPPGRARPAGPVRRELRLALAMRGGVSLAVWIGGAIAEIERLRQAGAGREGIYRELLEANRFGPVLVDVISGASAGGLNGAVYAAAQIHGFELGPLRQLWIELADMERLARETTAGARAAAARRRKRPIDRRTALRPASLLEGDDYFYRQMRQALAVLATRPDPEVPRAERLEMLLSATLFDPQPVQQAVNDHVVLEDLRASALFRFRYPPRRPGDPALEPPGGTAPGPAPSPAAPPAALAHTGPAREDALLGQLAMAARATSSFPVAFEPARVGVGHPSPGTVVDDIDFTQVFEVPSIGTGPASYEVIDGGVLDNIPVASAIDAIVAAPADGPTHRWLCYLHPSPSDPVPAARFDPGQPRGVRTTLRTFLTRLNQESLLSDIDELTGVNEAQARRTLARRAALAPFGTDDLAALAAHLAQAGTGDELRAVLARFEADRVRANLQRPDRVGLAAASVARWPAPSQSALEGALAEAMVERSVGISALDTLAGQQQAIDLLVAYARTVESVGRPDVVAHAGRLKAGLYQLRAQLDATVTGEAERWTASAPNPPVASGIGPWVRRTVPAVAAALAGPIAAQRRQILATAAELVGLEVDPSDLDTPFCLLRTALITGGEPSAGVGAGVGAGDRLAPVLDGLVLALGPVGLIGPGPWGPIEFVYVTGDAPSAVAFPRLVRQGQLRAATKLCGNKLGNFAAFLSARWRANDWFWGRMDAASTLVAALTPAQLLAEPEARARLAGLAGVDPSVPDEQICHGIRARLQAEIVADELPVAAATPEGPLDAGAPVAPDPATYDVGLQTVVDLDEQRRLRVGMRLAHLAFAVLRPSEPTVLSGAVRFGMSLVKPAYLAAMTALLAPGRALLAIAIGAAAIQCTFWTATRGGLELGPVTWLLAAVALVGALAYLQLGRRLTRLRAARVARRIALATASRQALSAVVTLGFGMAFVIRLLGHGGGRYVTLAFVDLGLLGVSGWRLWANARQRQARRSLLGYRAWLTNVALYWVGTAVAAVVGLVVGWNVGDMRPDTAMAMGGECPGAPDWPRHSEQVLVLLVLAVVVTLIGNWWMRPLGRLAAAGVTVTIGLGTLTLTDFRSCSPLGLRPWLWLTIGVLLLVAAYLTDAVRLARTTSDPWTAGVIGPAVSVVVLGAVSWFAATGPVTMSLGAWSAVAVAAVSYSVAAMATYLPVFTRLPELDLVGAVTGVPRPARSQGAVEGGGGAVDHGDRLARQLHPLRADQHAEPPAPG